MTLERTTLATRALRGVLGLAALAVVLLPLVTVDEGLREARGRFLGDFHLVPGLLVFGLSLVLYGVAVRRGTLLRRDESGLRLRSLDVWLLLAFPIYLAYVGNGWTDQTGDNISSRFLPHQILHAGTADLAGVPYLDAIERGHYSTVQVDGRVLSRWPVGTPLLALPHAALAGALAGAQGPAEATYARTGFWAKHFAALATAASACLLFLGVRRRYGEGPGLATALVFALATTALSNLSQGMENLTGETLAVCAALALLLPESRSRWKPALAGVALGFAFTCRPSALVVVAGITLVVFVRDRRAVWPLAGAAAATVASVAALQLALFGHLLGGYGLMASRPGNWGGYVWSGLAGNLVSPGRGVLVYFPYLVVLGFTARHLGRLGRLDAWWTGSLALIAANYLLISLYTRWWGGNSVGPRLMGESAPFLALSTLPWWRSWRELGRQRVAIAAALALAVVAQAICAYDFRARAWHLRVAEPAGLKGIRNPEFAPLWSWTNGQLAAAFRPLPPRHYDRGPAWSTRPPSALRVDLAPAANARYEVHAFRPRAPQDPWMSFPRVHPRTLNEDGALFHFAPPGTPNAVTTFQRPSPRALAVSGWPARRLHAVMTAGSLEVLSGQPVIAFWEVTYVDGQREELPIRLDADVFEFRAKRRSASVPAGRVYAGRPEDDDVLLHSSWSLGRPNVGIRTLRLRGAPEFEGRPVGICLLALSIELPAGEV